MQYDINAFNQLIKSRRSVFPKQFEAGKKVDDAIVQQLLENATWAPNHGQTEPWRFVVFTGEGLKKLAQFQANLYKESSGENFKEATYNNLLETPLKASHVIALCMKRNEAKRFNVLEEVEAVACAVQNIYLSTTVYGVGGYWTTGGVTYNEKAKPFFGLEEDDKLLGFFYIGQIAVPSPGAKRKPVEEVTTWVRE
ncbi:MAG TPA: nitroreductase [Chitinophagaceae bacterium]|jgi:nitroreductase|nr:nitroreductase [Chitinophagaceae bacterium]